MIELTSLKSLRLRKLLDFSALPYWVLLGLGVPFRVLLSYVLLYEVRLPQQSPYQP